MNISIISVRKNTDPLIAQLEAVYLKRLKGTCSVRLVDIRPVYTSNLSVETVIERESEKIGTHLQEGTFHQITLDPSGKTVSSEAFSKLLRSCLERKGPDIRFVIGGPNGLSLNLKKNTDHCISLSPLTFTHEFARLILLEQIFRSTTIWSGSGYHK